MHRRQGARDATRFQPGPDGVHGLEPPPTLQIPPPILDRRDVVAHPGSRIFGCAGHAASEGAGRARRGHLARRHPRLTGARQAAAKVGRSAQAPLPHAPSQVWNYINAPSPKMLACKVAAGSDLLCSGPVFQLTSASRARPPPCLTTRGPRGLAWHGSFTQAHTLPWRPAPAKRSCSEFHVRGCTFSRPDAACRRRRQRRRRFHRRDGCGRQRSGSTGARRGLGQEVCEHRGAHGWRVRWGEGQPASTCVGGSVGWVGGRAVGGNASVPEKVRN